MTVRTESRIDAFRRTVPFELDPFQVDAIEQLGTHQGVLVSAPTSSGKTVVADYAIFEALEDGVKAIYTTPLKALSNQKFRATSSWTRSTTSTITPAGRSGRRS